VELRPTPPSRGRSLAERRQALHREAARRHALVILAVAPSCRTVGVRAADDARRSTSTLTWQEATRWPSPAPSPYSAAAPAAAHEAEHQRERHRPGSCSARSASPHHHVRRSVSVKPIPDCAGGARTVADREGERRGARPLDRRRRERLVERRLLHCKRLVVTPLVSTRPRHVARRSRSRPPPPRSRPPRPCSLGPRRHPPPRPYAEGAGARRRRDRRVPPQPFTTLAPRITTPPAARR